MSSEQLALELASLFSLSVAVLLRAADIVKELRRRNVAVRVKTELFGNFVPKIADGLLAAEVVSALADCRGALRAVATLPIDAQIRLANGERVPVVAALDKPVVYMDVRAAFEAGHNHVICGRRVLSIEQQKTLLRAKAKAGNKPAKAKKPTAPKAEPPSEEEVERLTWKLNELLASRNLRPSPSVIVKLCLELGWGPTR